MGLPVTLISVIQKQYQHVEVQGDVNAIKSASESKSGAKQGDSLAPALSLFGIQAAL